MSIKNLSFGDSVAGLLIDGVEETPFVGATLRLLDSGVEVEVPYLPGFMAEQFAHIDNWFHEMKPPENLMLRTPGGTVMLYGCQWRGHSQGYGSRTNSGRISCQETLLHERDGELSAPLTVSTCRSRVDGLNLWARLSALSWDSHIDPESHTPTLVVTVKNPEDFEWTQGDAKLRISSHWASSENTDAYERTHVFTDNVVIESEFDDPRPFVDHFIEQRKVSHLLIFLFGAPLSFREHRVQDESIPARLMGGKVYDYPFVELISPRTIRERTYPTPTDNALGQPLMSLHEVGTKGLARWAEKYEQWNRFFLPAVTVVGRQQRFTEDVVLSTSMALEAAGQLLGTRPGEEDTYSSGRNRKATMTTYVYRCLSALEIRWGDYIYSQVGLARAISNNYRGVKHADNGPFPDHVETHLVSVVNELVVRLLAANLTGAAGELLDRYREGEALSALHQTFKANQLRIADDQGTWESSRP